jgi:anthranilate/para-aminobenzoate synthase component I
MQQYLEKVKKAKIGSIVPIYKEYHKAIDPIEYFAKLSDYGRKKDCLLLESADIVQKYGELSLGTSNPCLKLTGKGHDFEIKALNALGSHIIKELRNDFKFCEKAVYKKGSIKGKLQPVRKAVSEDERLKLKTHVDIIRHIAFKFTPTEKPFIPYCGLFGNISYDFIDQFEDLPQNKQALFEENDYELYFGEDLQTDQ